MPTPIDERRAVWEELATSYPADLLDDMVDRQVGLDGCSAALATVAAGGVRGRVLVRPDPLTGQRPVGGQLARLRQRARVSAAAAVPEKTGETVIVPLSHGDSWARQREWSYAFGGVTSSVADVGHVVSLPDGTSE